MTSLPQEVCLRGSAVHLYVLLEHPQLVPGYTRVVAEGCDVGPLDGQAVLVVAVTQGDPGDGGGRHLGLPEIPGQGWPRLPGYLTDKTQSAAGTTVHPRMGNTRKQGMMNT